MTSKKGLYPDASVKARMHQYESKVASADHLSKHPEQFRKRNKKGSVTSGNDSEEEDIQDGNFEFAELLRALTLDSTSSENGNSQNALREAFKILDCDEDGFITLSDLREAMTEFDDDEEEEEEMSDEDLIDMIAAADDSGNGKISFESFVRILEPNKKHDKNSNSYSRNRSER